ncbi:AAA-domain-containing protein [Schizopora paradoxa]|uniref:AAA-domain-containing protein n=1 Tax=Schizopora paradoxa TaxID=27342 RepID=A0A0H2RUW8_9AGAM|nr:AAA-domain-containing protein [Schizopora paradoxa]
MHGEDVDIDADGEPDIDAIQQPEVKRRVTLRLNGNGGEMARSVVDGVTGRRNLRPRKSSGSEYSAGNRSASGSGSSHGDVGMRMDDDGEEEEEKPVKLITTSSGRHTAQRRSYVESEEDPEEDSGLNLFSSNDNVTHYTRSRAKSVTTTTTTTQTFRQQTLMSDDEGEVGPVHSTRSRSKRLQRIKENGDEGEEMDILEQEHRPNQRLTRSRLSRMKKARRPKEEDDMYDATADHEDQAGSSEYDDADHTSPEPDPEPELDGEGDIDVDADGEPDDGANGVTLEDPDGKPYAFRRRTKQINYAIPPPLEEIRPAKGPSKQNKGKGRAGPGWSANGTELARYMGGLPADDSDSDYPTRTPRKPFSAGAGGGLFAAGGGGMFPNDLAAVGTPSNLGKVSDAALADADPLGVNQNVTFEEVGGLDDHINSLKEMTLLPLLYPEVFQRFNLTPPRGVLFHGPPGTGKTLLARALAASCRSNGKGISFFMRKGADCLSKWVGEAERQLRLLFEEARNQQPSIIFFDEIDGLAPVRSSKQDQIHASIVSTLLALMDGMDGRGQVIVIGATNRPDAVDPALRRPGRFDREFYFPLPNIDARKKILGIITKKWDGWGDGSVEADQTIERLAKLTRGYGGADLRALCTEAALNAVQRRYPQIYRSNDRLLLKPETIGVQARDFMISVKKLIPSSARSTASSASPIPTQLLPLLEDALEATKKVLDRALPLGKKRTALEEAEWEDEGDEGALDREIMMQSMETLRVYRPRVIIHGPTEMGQGYIGSAALHHLEGYHIQTLDLGTLMGDSTRTAEAAIIQLFVEAKRHQPSIIYIPSLLGWCAAISETARATVRSMLDSLSPSDPVLLLAIVDGPFQALPRDVRSWFGLIRENRIALSHPSTEQRRKFFETLLVDIRRPPNQFPDGVKRKKRVLEELPIAPPIEPRQPTAAELAVQEENDQKIITLLKYRLGPILTELKRKFKRFTKRAADEYNLHNEFADPFLVHAQPLPANPPQANGIIDIDGDPAALTNGVVNGTNLPPPEPKLHDIDLERIHSDLYKGKYLTPQEFLEDIGKMVYNAEVRRYEDSDRLYKAQAMFTAAQVSIQEFDPQLRLECERMASRERKRRDQRREARDKAKAAAAEALRADVAGSGDGSGQEGGVGPRRSTRNNGQQLEISITDPVRLERQLKRQRSADANGNTRGSSEESMSDDRASKRSKMDAIEEEDDGPDPLDVVGPTSSQPRPTVRFENELNDAMQTPTRPLGIFPHPQSVFLTPIPEVASETRPSPSRLDQILNPTPSSQPQFLQTPNTFEQPEPPVVQEAEAARPLPVSSIVDITHPLSTQHIPPDCMSTPTPNHVPPVVPPPQSSSIQPENSDMPETVPEDPQALMEVDERRSPTPPPPTFTISDDLVVSLETSFVEHTSHLSVEQLEQLRATCLGSIWRHRQEWDRDALVRELMGVITEFSEEATSYEHDMDDM